MEGDVCVAASPGKCDDTVVSVHVVWTAETSRFVRVEGGQGSVCNLSLTDGSDMVGVTLLRELAGKLSKRLPYLFGAGQEADPSTFVRLVLKLHALLHGYPTRQVASQCAGSDVMCACSEELLGPPEGSPRWIQRFLEGEAGAELVKEECDACAARRLREQRQ